MFPLYKEEEAVQRRAILTLTAILMLVAIPTGSAQEYKPLYPGFPSIRESKAYKKFAVRPVSNLSKIIYLIDRFGEADVEILYDNQAYLSKFAMTVSRWFVARNYKKQTPEEWIQRWCSHSVMSNKLIYIKLPNGEFRLAKDVLLEEVAALEAVMHENQMQVASNTVADVALDKPESAPLLQEIATPKLKIS